jgi:type IV pilus assembly protein PilB
VDCVVAQRLIRRLCERCKIAYFPTTADLDALGIDTEIEEPPEELYQAMGCQSCSKTGYNGRFALHEVLLLSEELKGMVADRAHTEDIKKVAIAQGMYTLRRSGLAHVRLGNTSVEEMLRVVA